MIDQYSGLLLQAVQYNPKRQRVEVKSVWDDESLWTPSSTTAQTDQTATYYRAVPWLYRGIDFRANSVANMPFSIYRGETEVETSALWEDKLGIVPDPFRLLWLIEAALCFGPAYVWRERNRVKTTALRYVAASTITPELDEMLGLRWFVRQVGTQRMVVQPEDLLYFWKPDPHVELGPPAHTPVGAALAAAGVLYNADQFAAAFFARGAIKATMLTVEGNPSPDAKVELKRWWQKAVTGINNSFAANVISASVKPVVVGDGLESLQDATLTATKREDISTALGIPQTLLFSTGAGGLGGGGVVRQDDLHYYTKTVVPECNFIAGILNEQFFRPMGLRFEFKPETLDVFQADENERATAFGAYVTAGLPVELVGEMLGLELPDGWTWERIAKEKEERAAAVAEQMQAAPADDSEDQDEDEDDGPAKPTPFDAKAMIDDLRAWRRKSQKRGRLADFESYAIPDATMTAIRAAGDEWLKALDTAIEDPSQIATRSPRTALDGFSGIEPYNPTATAEKAQREPDRAAEEALRRKLQATLQAQRARVAQAIADSAEIDWDTIAAELRGVLAPALAGAATTQAGLFAAGLNIPLDIAKINVAAWAWANQYSFELVKGINATTQQLVGQVVSQFIATPGMTIGDLAAAIEVPFGAARAQMIAVTETTRAYTQANRVTQSMLREMGVNTVLVWQTSKDDKTCTDICLPLDGLEESEWGDHADGPPAHVNCRCGTTSKVVR